MTNRRELNNKKFNALFYISLIPISHSLLPEVT